jgi:heptosyltransferase-2
VEVKKKRINHHFSQISKILILQTAFIGDVILTTPLVRAVRRLYPQAEIQFLTIPLSYNILETNPHLKKIWIYDKQGIDRGVLGLVKIIKKLRSETIDLAIVPHRSIRSAFLVFGSGIPQRIGFNRSTGKFLFNHTVKYLSNVHEIERNMTLINYITPVVMDKYLPEIFVNQFDQQIVTSLFSKMDLRSTQNIICMAPGSIWPTKRWPVKYWIQLIKLLAKDGYKTILIGSEDDKYLAEQIKQCVPMNVVDAMGKFTIRQSGEVIHRSRLLVSNDSAPTHLGVAVGTPVLTIFGSTVPSFGFYPFGQKNRVAEIKGLSCRPCTDHGRTRCPKEHFKCMLDLTPELLFQIVMEMLYENSKN